jgi:hypothetical protein
MYPKVSRPLAFRLIPSFLKDPQKRRIVKVLGFEKR